MSILTPLNWGVFFWEWQIMLFLIIVTALLVVYGIIRIGVLEVLIMLACVVAMFFIGGVIYNLSHHDVSPQSEVAHGSNE